MKENNQTTLRPARDRVPSSPALPSDSPSGVRAPAALQFAHGIEGAASLKRGAGLPLAGKLSAPDGLPIGGSSGGQNRLSAERHQRGSAAELHTASASRTASDLDREHLLLTIREAARLARISPRSIQRQIKSRPAWALRFGAAWRIDRERFLAAGQRAARQAI
jgi:hypothetical protein